MTNSRERIKREVEKGCYGSDEYSLINKICKKCNWYGDCGKIRKRKLIKKNRKLNGEKRLVWPEMK